MSKEQTQEQSAVGSSFVPTAPPSYDEAMQHAGASLPAMQGSHSMPSQQMPMAMAMPQSHLQSVPMTNYFPAQTVSPPPPAAFQAPQAPTVLICPSLGRDRSFTMCPECNSQVMTQTVEKHKCLAHFFCCCLMFSCPCFSCVPYCMDSCKIVKHACPNCGAHLGTFRP